MRFQRKIALLLIAVQAATLQKPSGLTDPYRPSMKPAEALAELRRCAGSQFRSEVVEALAVVLEKKDLV